MFKELAWCFSEALNALAVAAVIAVAAFYPVAVKAATAHEGHGFECVIHSGGFYLPCAEFKMEASA